MSIIFFKKSMRRYTGMAGKISGRSGLPGVFSYMNYFKQLMSR